MSNPVIQGSLDITKPGPTLGVKERRLCQLPHAIGPIHATYRIMYHQARKGSILHYDRGSVPMKESKGRPGITCARRYRNRRSFTRPCHSMRMIPSLVRSPAIDLHGYRPLWWRTLSYLVSASRAARCTINGFLANDMGAGDPRRRREAQGSLLRGCPVQWRDRVTPSRFSCLLLQRS